MTGAPVTFDPAGDDVEAMLAGRAPERGASGRLRLGEVVDGWRVEAFLGEGRSAEVYRVVDVRPGGSGRDGALKLLSDGAPAMRTRFLREIEILSKAESAHLPRFFASGERGGVPYCVIEYLQPLFLPLDRAAAAPFAVALAKAVGDLNAMGFAHRDVKPGNVLLRRSGEPVLVDFGLAAEMSGGGVREGVGTPGFSAPEQMMYGRFGARSDVFSLGKMLRAAYPGRPPRRVLDVVRRATSDDPADRYADAAEFAAAVERAASRRWGAWAMGVAAAAVVGVAAWAAVSAVAAKRGGGSGGETEFAARVSGGDASPKSGGAEPMVSAPPQMVVVRPAALYVQRDGESDEEWFRRILALAEGGDAAAETNVAEAYFHGRGVAEDKAEAVRRYEAAAERGNDDARASLGLCRLRGLGCERDEAAAVALFEAAAADGHLGAMNDLAYCVLNGVGCARDPERGFALAEKAAERGHPASQTMVGECYLVGIGVERSAERADVWLQSAARRGNARAKALLGRK